MKRENYPTTAKQLLMLASCALVAIPLTFIACGDDEEEIIPPTEQPGGEQPGGEQPGGEQPGGEEPGDDPKMPTDADYSLANVEQNLLPGTWCPAVDGQRWVRYNADYTYDMVDYDPESYDGGYNVKFNYGTWSISPNLDDERAYYGIIFQESEDGTEEAEYLFINKDKLQITISQGPAQYVVTFIRSTWPTWDNTGDPATSQASNARLLEGQWEATPELQEYMLNIIRTNAQTKRYSAIADCVDQPVRIEFSNTPNKLSAIVHFGEIPSNKPEAALAAPYAGKWVAVSLGTLAWRPSTYTDGYFILKNTLRPDGYNIQYTRLGNKGIYIMPGKKNHQTDTPDGWFHFLKPAETITYVEFPISL